MEKSKILELIDFFNGIYIEEQDVTTDEERANGQLVVVVTYHYQGRSFTTQKLYYRDIALIDEIKDKKRTQDYFGRPVYWLDIEKHDWPKPKGECDLDDLIVSEIANQDDLAFKDFLLTLANNKKTGCIQQFTRDGETGQYHHNLLNNNHWHDLVNLIKAYISSRGNNIDEKYFSRLVFMWQEGQRKSLSLRFGERYIIIKLQQNIKSVQNDIMHNQIIELLKYKKQIILQGPPGTGKTRMAKEVAAELTRPDEIATADIDMIIKSGLIVESSTGYAKYTIGAITAATVTIILEKGTSYSVSKTKIVEAYGRKLWRGGQFGGNDPYDAAVAKYIYENYNSGEYFKLIQFHPAYSYEDFVRGIETKVSADGKTNYEVVDKVLAKLAATAAEEENAKKAYVLIIDEINRANLPAVLGELIYALEYRGEPVNSMYALPPDGDTKIVLPPNLYIIGTMNTADRSVGHIDYAIRRRFAFVDVLPDTNVVSSKGGVAALTLYNKVRMLFYKKDNERSDFLASDFKPEDVMIGHSYFLENDAAKLKIRLDYEIRPILKEYVKDGILNNDAMKPINELGV